jgi:hypothetical protein
MRAVRVVSFVVAAAASSLSIVSAAPAQLPSVPGVGFRVDAATGALTPLEFTKAHEEKRRGYLYCYLEGASSPVTFRHDEPLLFAYRWDGWRSDIERVLKSEKAGTRDSSRSLYQLEFLSVSDNGRRYGTGKLVPTEDQLHGEVVSGVNPKKPKNVGQSFLLKPREPLAPGEYALVYSYVVIRRGQAVLAGMVRDAPYGGSAACTADAVSAFRIVEGAPLTQPAPLPSPSTPSQGPAAPANSAADIERLRRAAEQGDVASQINLAAAYATGNGVPQDYPQTQQWLRKGADQGSAEAQYWLGVMYRDAVGVAPDQAETARLFRKAADQGHALAQGNLGNLHFFGRGVLQDYVEAHKWLNIAAARLEGEDRRQCVELRDKVAGLMTPVQLAEGQARAVAWVEAFEQAKR